MAGSVNKVILIGIIDREPGDRVGNAPVSFSVETEQSWTDRNGDSKTRKQWHTVVALGDPFSSFAEANLKKGARVWVEGMLATRSWEHGGKTRYATEVILRGFKCKLDLLTNERAGGSGGGSQRARSAADYGYDEPGVREPDSSDQYDMSRDEEAAHTGRRGSRAGGYEAPQGYDPNRRPRTTYDTATTQFDQRDEELPF